MRAERTEAGRGRGRELYQDYSFAIRLEVSILFIHSTDIYGQVLCAKRELAFLLTEEVI